MKYIWMCSEANTWSSYYYDEQTEEFFVFEGGTDLWLEFFREFP